MGYGCSQYFIIKMKKKVCILGSTGKIGKLCLEVISKKKNLFKVIVLSGNNNYKLLIQQIKKFSPKYIYLTNSILEKKILSNFKKKKIIIVKDLKYFTFKIDITVNAISGINGLKPTLDIIKNTKEIGIVNKESIICGWSLINKELKKYNCKFYPLDSEHFALAKLLNNQNRDEICSIYIPASGGPFFKKKINLNKVKVNQVIKHPIWRMGKKNSIDSANLINKVLEIIEASLIFNISIKKFYIFIHPESNVHSAITFKNETSIMSYYKPDMKVVLKNFFFKKNFKLYDKKKYFLNNSKKIEFSFYKLENKYNYLKKILKFAYLYKQNAYIAINLINEILVNKFINKKIKFPEIVNKIIINLNRKNIKKQIKYIKLNSLNNILKFHTFIKLNLK